MYNYEECNLITIKNKEGKVIATLDTNSLTCSNKKFKIRGGHYEDELVIQLMQKSYS